MAYYGTYYSGGNAMTSSCLDGVPFKLGPKFLPPTKVFLPPELESDLNKPSRSSLLHEEYPFEVEEAVLKWSAERERQLEEQQRQAEEQQALVRSSQETDSSDSGTDQAEATAAGNQPIYQNVSNDPNYENPGILRPQPVPRTNIPKPINSVSNPTYVPVSAPNPLIANISNDILTPTPIQSSASNGQALKRSESKEKKKDFDMTWFEKEDDPFDKLELQTINDMEELASVLEETKKASPVGVVSGTSDISTTQSVENGIVEKDTAASDQELPLYENVELKQTQNSEQTQEEVTFDIRKLPPIPPRRDLVGAPPLPPIGRKSIDSALDQVSQTSSGVSSSQTYDNFSVSASFPKYENPKATISHRPAVTKPPRTFKYSRHNMEAGEGEDNSQNSDGDLYVQSRTTQSDPDLKSCVDVDPTSSTEDQSVENELNFVNCHFGSNPEQQGEGSKSKPIPAPRKLPSPPSRPSSAQSWNRYNLLPPPPGQTPSPSPDSYAHLTNEARTSVDNLVAMGFPKSRVIRAVEKLGDDQKEVVEYLCLVDQLTEKGFDLTLAENALLLFQNSMIQASKYLELFKQFEELGFSGDRIKEALVNTQNDRERSLDILTAS